MVTKVEETNFSIVKKYATIVIYINITTFKFWIINSEILDCSNLCPVHEYISYI